MNIAQIPSDIYTITEMRRWARDNNLSSSREPFLTLTANIEKRLSEMESLNQPQILQIQKVINASARQETPCKTPKQVLNVLRRVAFSGWHVTREGYSMTKKAKYCSLWGDRYTLAKGRVWGTEATYRRVRDSELYAICLRILEKGGPLGSDHVKYSESKKVQKRIEETIDRSNQLAVEIEALLEEMKGI